VDLGEENIKRGNGVRIRMLLGRRKGREGLKLRKGKICFVLFHV